MYQVAKMTVSNSTSLVVSLVVLLVVEPRLE